MSATLEICASVVVDPEGDGWGIRNGIEPLLDRNETYSCSDERDAYALAARLLRQEADRCDSLARQER